MPVHVAIVPAALAHAEALAPRLRAADVAEVRALGDEPIDALLASVAHSSVAYATFFDGEPAALCGVVPCAQTLLGDSGVGCVWMLSGHACSAHPKHFLRTSRVITDVLLGRYAVLGNIIDARYTGALRWAAWLGAQVQAPRPLGPFGMLFCPFVLRRTP